MCTDLLQYIHCAGILYILVYRTENYKRLKSTIEKQTKRCKEMMLLEEAAFIIAAFYCNSGAEERADGRKSWNDGR